MAHDGFRGGDKFAIAIVPVGPPEVGTEMLEWKPFLARLRSGLLVLSGRFETTTPESIMSLAIYTSPESPEGIHYRPVRGGVFGVSAPSAS